MCQADFPSTTESRLAIATRFAYIVSGENDEARKDERMKKKLTISIDAKVHDELHEVIGEKNISRFIEDAIRLHVLNRDLETRYAQMAQDKAREAEALEWSEGTLGDVSDEPR